jgi:hypothetical protein
MSSLAKRRYSPEQYPEIERATAFKSEFLSGEMFAMAGALGAHVLMPAALRGIIPVRGAPMENSDGL